MLVVAVIMVAKNHPTQDAVAGGRDWAGSKSRRSSARANHALDEVQSVMARVRAYRRRHQAARGATGAGDRVHQVSDLVRAGSSPLVGIIRGASAALSVLVNGKHDSRATGAGGTGHARS